MVFGGALGFGSVWWECIFEVQEASPQTWSVFGCLVVVSGWWPRHAKTLGWRADNLWVATRRAVPFFMLAALAICGAGLFWDFAAIPAHLIEPRRFTGILLLRVQQVALNSYLTNRLLGCFEKAWRRGSGRGDFCGAALADPVLVR